MPLGIMGRNASSSSSSYVASSCSIAAIVWRKGTETSPDGLMFSFSFLPITCNILQEMKYCIDKYYNKQ